MCTQLNITSHDHWVHSRWQGLVTQFSHWKALFYLLITWNFSDYVHSLFSAALWQKLIVSGIFIMVLSSVQVYTQEEAKHSLQVTVFCGMAHWCRKTVWQEKGKSCVEKKGVVNFSMHIPSLDWDKCTYCNRPSKTAILPRCDFAAGIKVKPCRTSADQVQNSSTNSLWWDGAWVLYMRPPTASER